MSILEKLIQQKNIKQFIETRQDDVRVVIEEKITDFFVDMRTFVIENYDVFAGDNEESTYGNIKDFVALGLFENFSSVDNYEKGRLVDFLEGKISED